MKRLQKVAVVVVLGLLCSGAWASVVHDYENQAEGFLGETFTDGGVTYRDANRVSGFYADGQPFGPTDLGNQYISEDATYFYDAFPTYGSPVHSLTFGTAYVPGPNLSLGALASAWMDLADLSNAASLDIGYYENGPWGGIEYRLDAVRNGVVVGTDSFLISDLGGRDNPTFRTMSVSGVEFDSLHLSAWKNGNYTVPRGIIDDLTITAVPEPASAALVALLVLGLRRR